MAALPSQAPLFPLVISRLFPAARGSGNRGGVWIQGVSVGEVEIALTLAELLSSLDPGLPLLFTSTTPAGVGLLSRRRPGAWPRGAGDRTGRPVSVRASGFPIQSGVGRSRTKSFRGTPFLAAVENASRKAQMAGRQE